MNPTMSTYQHAGPLMGDSQQNNGQQYQAHIPGAPIDGGLNGLMSQMNTMSLGPGMAQAGYPAALGPAMAYPAFHDGQYFLTTLPGGQNTGGVIDAGYGATYVASIPQYAPANMVSYVPPAVPPYTPGRTNSHNNRSDRGHRENIPPPLDTGRRGSYSTNESTPVTPFYSGLPKDSMPRVSIVGLDRSAYTTPSPQQTALTPLNGEHGMVAKPILSPIDQGNLAELLKRDPAIPRAIPAVFTQPNQSKSLEQSLENHIPGNRNVYIRGLHPTTDDELLLKYAERFGEVETSKAIIDTATGACKGFGFAKFVDVRDSEKCIAGFFRLGYEVGFARESFNSRLKAEGDESSTNLYISNLPKNMTEMDLANIFQDYTILSSKILRDNMGNSRGVGFARFETRDICDEIIKNFNGASLPDPTNPNPQGNPLLMNIRYADTPAQKELKRVTAERRQFRTNEYNIGAYGTAHVGMQPHTYGVTSSYRRTYPAFHNGPRGYTGMNGQVRYGGDRVSSVDVGHQQSSIPVTNTETPSPPETDDGAHAEEAKEDEAVEASPSIKKENN